MCSWCPLALPWHWWVVRAFLTSASSDDPVLFLGCNDADMYLIGGCCVHGEVGVSRGFKRLPVVAASPYWTCFAEPGGAGVGGSVLLGCRCSVPSALGVGLVGFPFFLSAPGLDVLALCLSHVFPEWTVLLGSLGSSLLPPLTFVPTLLSVPSPLPP